MLILFLILIVLALVILIANIAIVPQAYSYVVERKNPQKNRQRSNQYKY